MQGRAGQSHIPLTGPWKSHCHFCSILVTTWSVLFHGGGDDPRGEFQEAEVTGSDWRLATAVGLMEKVAFEHICGWLTMDFQVFTFVTQRRLTKTSQARLKPMWSREGYLRGDPFVSDQFIVPVFTSWHSCFHLQPCNYGACITNLRLIRMLRFLLTLRGALKGRCC